MKPYHLPLLVTALLISCLANAQQYICEYDAAGNRVKRYYTDLVPRSAVIPLEEDTVYVSTVAIPLAKDSIYIPTATFSDLNNAPLDYQEENNTDNSQEQTPFRMVIYPNPTTGYFTLELPDLQAGTTGSLMILSQSGLPVYSQNNLTQVQTINIFTVTTGLYFVRIVAGNKLYVVNILKH
ncbi:MAG: T9SS type A sorting domain-containing protein [Prevotellaceae bacterium]|jgi:hypothetical protein|nr:T9SS type A sorting domain-containing protein [Prevotellaceae bacterium]